MIDREEENSKSLQQLDKHYTTELGELFFSDRQSMGTFQDDRRCGL